VNAGERTLLRNEIAHRRRIRGRRGGLLG
jgi:hypothetical protein